MATDNMQNSFRRGVMSMVILSLLERKDMYGYQLVQEIEIKSRGKLTTQEGSLYPVLYKLLDQELISDRKVLVGKRMTRVYYHLEPTGIERLKELVREYEEMTQGVLQIIKGENNLDTCSTCSEVSVGTLVDDTVQRKKETPDFGQGNELRPGLCF